MKYICMTANTSNRLENSSRAGREEELGTEGGLIGRRRSGRRKVVGELFGRVGRSHLTGTAVKQTLLERVGDAIELALGLSLRGRLVLTPSLFELTALLQGRLGVENFGPRGLT